MPTTTKTKPTKAARANALPSLGRIASPWAPFQRGPITGDADPLPLTEDQREFLAAALTEPLTSPQFGRCETDLAELIATAYERVTAGPWRPVPSLLLRPGAEGAGGRVHGLALVSGGLPPAGRPGGNALAAWR